MTTDTADAPTFSLSEGEGILTRADAAKVKPAPSLVFEVATFNPSARDNAGATRVIRSLMARPAMLALATQESRWMTGREGAAGWEWFRVHPACPVWWDADRDEFDRYESGMWWISDETPIEPVAAGPTNSPEKWLQWTAGWLAGRKIVVASVHLSPSVQHPKADALNDRQVARVLAFVATWRARGYEVVVMGDFNFTPSHANYRPIAAAGLTLANRTAGPTHGNRLIDFILVTPGLVVVSAAVLPGHLRDDHRVATARLRFR